MKNLYIYLVTLISISLCSCIKESETIIVPEMEYPINISAVYPTLDTRVDANGFVAGDGVGIFVIDYNRDGKPGELKMNSVRAANALFEYDGASWSATYQLYWADKSTPADFYGYYPYDTSMETPTAYPFAVQSHQQSDDLNTTSGAGYEKSDFLWAKATKVYPTSQAIHLKYKHLMAGVNISLEMGEGFTEEEWCKLDKVVILGKTNLSGVINLSNGIVKVNNDSQSHITPLLYNGNWRAVVMPQTIPAGENLVIVSVGGQSYEFVKDIKMTYNGGKMHNFTFKVNKRENGGDYEFVPMPESIVAWTEDPDFHEGIVREYIIINVDEPGTLSQKIDDLGYDYIEINALKITGTVNHEDLNFIGRNLIALTALNIRDIKITGNKDEEDVLGGIGNQNVTTLNHVVLPRYIKKIAGGALRGVGLVGAIDIPDCVEEIGWEAFGHNHITGEIKLPSALKQLYGGAFVSNNGISGELHLPEGLEGIGGGVFDGARLTGPLILPSTLNYYENIGFSGTMGTLVIPPKLTTVPNLAFAGTGCTKVEFHEGIREIGSAAFRHSQISGELVLPPNLKYIGGEAFAGTKITRIIFPESLMVIGDGHAFANCHYLTGVVELPKNVSRIPYNMFDGCYNITGIIIPEGVELIEISAFKGCSSIGSIVCHAKTPPVICENAFYGVAKDNFTVEVPKGCVNAYKLAPGWSEFKRIAEYSDFVCRPAQANALNNVHSEDLVLNANGPWRVVECPDWILLNKMEGNGKSELRLTFKELEHGAGNRSGVVKFEMPEEGYETSIDVAQYDYEHDEDSAFTFQEHTKGNGNINLIFMGDGYDSEAISNGSYLALVEQQIAHFFDVEPYKSLREYFNVHILFPLSQECGVNTMYTYVNNHFGTLYGYDGTICTTNQLITTTDEVISYAKNLVPTIKNNMHKTLIVLVPNDDNYDGSTLYTDATISICPPSNRPYPQDTRGVIQHEACGHGFGKLADESVEWNIWVPISAASEINSNHERGWYKNVATTSKFNSVPWADFIFDTRYSDRVDIFEGAYGYMRGVFRSEQNSCMNYGIPYLNTISRLEITKRIFDYAGEHFTMDYFYENDTFEWGDTGEGTRSAYDEEYLKANSYTLTNSHRSPTISDAKAMGDAVRDIRTKLNKN